MPLKFAVVLLGGLAAGVALTLGAVALRSARQPGSAPPGVLPAALAPQDEHAGHAHAAGAAVHTESHPPPEADWCAEHGVPESACTRCNPELIAAFRERGDWCAGHGLPESQCVLCNPELAPPPPPRAGLPVTSRPAAAERRVRDARGDPECGVEQLLITLPAEASAAWADIRSEPAARRPITAYLECPAEVQYDQTRLAHVRPRARGTIAEVRVSPGAVVKAGEVLAVLDSPVLADTRSQFIEQDQGWQLAQAELAQHEAIHSAAQRMLALCTPEASAAEVRQALGAVRIGEGRSRLLSAHAALELARNTLQREEALAAQGVGTARALEAARSALETATAEFTAAHESVALGLEQEHRRLERNVTVAAAARAAAERRLGILGESAEALAVDQPAAFARYELRSPLAGTVVAQHAIAGESASEDETLFTVADLERLWLMLDLDERDLAVVALGQPVRFQPDGLTGRAYAGAITWLASHLDERTRRLRARVDLAGDGLLRANMFGLARVVVRAGEELLAVPQAALQTDRCCQIVFVQHSPTQFRPRKVVPGAAAGGYVEICAGLAPGEPVVATGSFLLKTEVLKGSLGAGCCEVDPGR